MTSQTPTAPPPTAQGVAPTHDVFSVIEAAQKARDLTDLTAIVQPAMGHLGVTHYIYGQATNAHGARAPLAHFGVAHLSWGVHYAERKLVTKDAMFPWALRSTDPFTWQGVRDLGQVDRDGETVLQDARAFQLTDGFVVPVHHLNGASGAVVMMGDKDLDWSPRQRSEAHLLAIYFAAVGRKLAAEVTPTSKPLLSRRQRECLQWVRAGKTDWEIAQILNLSEHTVIEYLEEARKRLGVRTRTQAVIEAIIRGQITV